MPNTLPPYGISRLPNVSDSDHVGDAIITSMRQQSALSDASFQARLAGKSPPQPMNEGNPFEQTIIDLSGATVGPTPGLSSTIPFPVDREGYAIYYRREGSNPMGRLALNIGGNFIDFAPGQRITGYFKRFDVLLSSRSSLFGFAQLVLEKRQDVHFLESNVDPIPGERFPPIDLIGNSNTPTFTPITVTAGGISAAPVGNLPTGAFVSTGIRRARMLIDTTLGSGPAATSFDLVPWLREANSGLWLEQGTERIGVPDTVTTGGRYRIVDLPLYGNGQTYFQFANAVASMTPGIIVQALE